MFSKIHEVIINQKSYYIHDEVMKYCHYFDTIAKGNFKENKVDLDFDIDNFDFNIIIDIFYRYHHSLENHKGSELHLKYRSRDDNGLLNHLMEEYKYFFALYQCAFKDFLNIITILDFLQSNIQLNIKWNKKYNLNDVLIDCYSANYPLNHIDIINANIDIKYRKKLMEYCMTHKIRDNDYPRHIYNLEIEEQDDHFECKNLVKYFEYYGVPLHKIEYQNYHIEHRVKYLEDWDYSIIGEEKYDELVADLYINDVKIREVNKEMNINSYIVNYIIDWLIKN